LKIENDDLHERLSRAEFEVNDLLQINTVKFILTLIEFKIEFSTINRYFEKNFKLHKLNSINYKKKIKT